MLLLRTDSLPNSEQWLYELKLDGYRAIAFRRDGVVHLRSRNDNDFGGRHPGVVKGLAKMPDNTVIDGEVMRSTMTGVPHSTLSRTMVQRQLRSSTTCSTC
jgi:bifunctional non-homologous end joining protein LigD